MSLWRLEWLRLVRTHRLLAVVGVYLLFGLTGPLTARYIGRLLETFGEDGVRIEFPEPVPADGITQFVGNVTQIGLLVVVMVASAALSFDARREMAVFLRTRVGHVRAIVLPAYAVNTGAAVVALLLGTLAAWYESALLLGALPPARLALGFAGMALFLAFAVATVACVAGLARGVLATAGVTLVLLLGLAVVGTATPAGRWLPTRLADAMAGLVRGAEPVDYLPAAAVTVPLTAALVAAAITLAARREL
jgi:ABC-2 type transport system permease protein